MLTPVLSVNRGLGCPLFFLRLALLAAARSLMHCLQYVPAPTGAASSQPSVLHWRVVASSCKVFNSAQELHYGPLIVPGGAGWSQPNVKTRWSPSTFLVITW